MPFQLFMVASPARLAIQFMREKAEDFGFRRVTPVAEGVGGLFGFCVLHHAERAHQDDPLARFLRMWSGREDAIKGCSTSIQLVGSRIPSDSKLLKEWSEWLQRQRENEENEFPDSKKDVLQIDLDAVDQARAEGIDNVFQAAARIKRQREFEQMVENAKARQKPDSAQGVEVVSARQEIIDQGKKIVNLHHHFSNPITVLDSLSRDGLIRDGLPPIAWDALALATSPKEEEAVLSLLKKIVAAIVRGSDDPQKHNRLALLADADPALFLPFCRPQPLPPEKQRDLFDGLQAALAERFFGRQELVRAVAANLARRLAGDQSVLTLLLHGPPGTGKSFLVTQLAEALGEAGMSANTVFQAMTEGGSWRGDEQLLFQLTGTAAHYSNADCGSLYRGTRLREHRLSLVLLDEAEKCRQRDFLVNLLDPRLPLEDSYVKGLVQLVDMRSKTVFFLSANDTGPLCRGLDDPLWSRLQPAWLRPYSQNEMETILLRKVEAECPFNPGARKVRTVIKRILDQDGGNSSLRKLLNEVNNELFLISLDRPEFLSPVEEMPPVSPRNVIGFRP